MEDLRTAKQKQRDFEHNRIVSLYLSFKSDENYSKCSDHQIFGAIARRPDINISTVVGVRNVLVNAGVYQNKR